MSEGNNGLRADQRTLYPMQHELNEEEQLRLKGGLSLWLMGLAIPIIMLVELRFIMAYDFVDPAANPVLGGIGLLLLIITGILLTSANSASKRGSQKTILNLYDWAILFSLAAMVVIAWQVFNGSMNSTSHYDMTLMASDGVIAFYVFCGVIALWATRGRVKRIPQIRNYWGTASTSYYLWFVTACWLIIYVLLYFI